MVAETEMPAKNSRQDRELILIADDEVLIRYDIAVMARAAGFVAWKLGMRERLKRWSTPALCLPFS